MDKKIGFLITHGTDTLEWGFPALKYMLKKLPCYVVITGSQIPMESRSSSDGFSNIRTSIEFLAQTDPLLDEDEEEENKEAKGITVVTVFNYGKDILIRGLTKMNKWEPDAFVGIKGGYNLWDDLKIYDGRISLEKDYIKHKLEDLYIIDTGGTISAIPKPATGGYGINTRDFDMAFMEIEKKDSREKNDQDKDRDVFDQKFPVIDFVRSNRRLVDLYEHLFVNASIGEDSSNLTLEHWKRIGNLIVDTVKSKEEPNLRYMYECDLSFDANVKILYPNPFMTRNDYQLIIDGFESKKISGLVVAGYGGGNCNMTSDDEFVAHSMEVVYGVAQEKGIVVVLASQVPKGPTDFVYEVGRLPVMKYQVLPSGELSAAESQVRLAYILGHIKEIKKKVKEYNKKGKVLTPYNLIRAIFMAGVEFRNDESQLMFEAIAKGELDLYRNDLGDPLIRMTFEQAVDEIIEKQPNLGSQYKSEEVFFQDLKSDFEIHLKEYMKELPEQKKEKEDMFNSIKEITMRTSVFWTRFPKSQYLKEVKTYAVRANIMLHQYRKAEELIEELGGSEEEKKSLMKYIPPKYILFRKGI